MKKYPEANPPRADDPHGQKQLFLAIPECFKSSLHAEPGNPKLYMCSED